MSRARSCNVWQWRRTVVHVLLPDFVNVRVCNLRSLNHTGHFFHIIQFLIFRLGNTGWMVVFTFRLRSLSFSFTISAEIWSLNGKTTRTVSYVSLGALGGDKGRCWSQTTNDYNENAITDNSLHVTL